MSLLWQSLLIAVTAVIVAFIIPAYRQPSLPVPEIFGTTAPGFENVREVFRRNYEDGWDVSEGGSAFSAYKDGEKVVDLWAGYADVEAQWLWREDTMSVIFSITKAMGALCVAMLANRGFVDFKKPVAHYWPEFAQNGKAKITVEQLLEHEGGNRFGSFGLGGQHGYADPTNGLSYGFVSRYMSPTGLNSDPRFINLQNSVLRSVKKLHQ